MSSLTPEQVSQFKTAFPSVIENEPMAKHASWRVGGMARLYAVAPSSEQLIKAVEAAEASGIPWYVLGGGSNILVSDDGFQGVVIQAGNRSVTLKEGTIMAESGAITAFVARQSVDAGLTGFEWAVGLPGTIGGAVYSDAGCFGGEMRDCVVSVDAYRVSDRKRLRLSREECDFGYRESRFKRERHLIFGCELALKKSPDVAASKAKLDDIMRQRKEKQPLGASSAGSVFKNFDFSSDDDLKTLRQKVDTIPEQMLAQKRLGAGWLIEQVGMKGFRVGAVEVSDKHGNFFVNRGNARAQDILALISIVKMKVRDELGIELQEEVQYLGF